MADHSPPQPGCSCPSCRTARILAFARERNIPCTITMFGNGQLARTFKETGTYAMLPDDAGAEGSSDEQMMTAAVAPPFLLRHYRIPPEILVDMQRRDKLTPQEQLREFHADLDDVRNGFDLREVFKALNAPGGA